MSAGDSAAKRAGSRVQHGQHLVAMAEVEVSPVASSTISINHSRPSSNHSHPSFPFLYPAALSPKFCTY